MPQRRPTCSRGRAVLILGALLCGATAAPAQDDWRYVVVPGDTLIGIAERWLQPPGDWRGLRRLNRINDPRRLRPGTELRVPIDWLRLDAAQAVAAAVSGTVEYLDGGAPPQALAAGARLADGQIVRTGSQSSAVIEFKDGSRVLLGPDSQVALQELRVQRGGGATSSTVRLDKGDAEASVPPGQVRPRFRVRTPVLDLGVRGTEFRARVDAAGAKATAEVLSGKVAAAPPSGEPALVEAGNGVVGSRDGLLFQPRPLLAAPDLSSVPAVVERLPPRLEWTAAGAGVGWRAQVFEAGGQARLRLDGRFADPAARWADLADGSYVLRVRGIDDNGLEGRAAERPFRMKARPLPPFVRGPAGDAKIYGPGARLEWAPTEDAASYRLQVAASPDFASPALEREGIAGPALDVELAPGTWHWRVRSVRADGDAGPWGDPQRFEQRAIPPTPDSRAPDLSGDRMVLRWTAQRPGDRFQFQLARDKGFQDVLIDRTESAPEIAFDKPSAGTYLLRARVVDADGFAGPWTPSSTVEVPRSPWWWLAPAVVLILVL